VAFDPGMYLRAAWENIPKKLTQGCASVQVFKHIYAETGGDPMCTEASSTLLSTSGTDAAEPEQGADVPARPAEVPGQRGHVPGQGGHVRAQGADDSQHSLSAGEDFAGALQLQRQFDMRGDLRGPARGNVSGSILINDVDDIPDESILESSGDDVEWVSGDFNTFVTALPCVQYGHLDRDSFIEAVESTRRMQAPPLRPLGLCITHGFEAGDFAKAMPKLSRESMLRPLRVMYENADTSEGNRADLGIDAGHTRTTLGTMNEQWLYRGIACTSIVTCFC